MKLYRFEKNEAHRLKTIEKKSIWISRPEDFNDLDDCSINCISHTLYDADEYQRIKECIAILYNEPNKFPLDKLLLEELIEYVSYCRSEKLDMQSTFRNQINKSAIMGKIHTHIKQSTGVSCFFAGEAFHPLMWAHYADNHKGFCIEYDASGNDEPIYKVNYSTSPFIASIHELLLCPHETLTRLLTTKSFEWNHEKEFRLIYLNEITAGQNGKEIPLPTGIKPKKIITGDRMEYSAEINAIAEKLGIKTVPYKNFTRKEQGM